MPLTKEEKAWLKKLQKIVDECPSSRLAAYTTGDQVLTVYDASKDIEIDRYMGKHPNSDFCHGVADTGAELSIISFPFPIHSTAG